MNTSVLECLLLRLCPPTLSVSSLALVGPLTLVGALA